MKHLLNDLSSDERNRILEQHRGGMSVDTSKFKRLLESKQGDVKPLVNESLLLTLGGIALGAGVMKRAYDYLSNRSLKNKMVETGEVKRSSSGKYVMKQYEDKNTGELFWGIDVTDKTRDEGFQDRNVLLFDAKDPKRIEDILNYYEKNPGHMSHFDSDEMRMSDDYEKRFGPYIADRSISMGSDEELGKKGGSKEEKISDISFDDEIKGHGGIKGDLMLVKNPRTGKTELPGMGPKGSSDVKLKTKKYVDGVLKTFDSEGNEIED